MKKLLLLLLLSLPSYITYADNLTFKGNVFSQMDSLPIQNVKVEVLSIDSTYVANTQSKDDGVFALNIISKESEGTYIIKISKHGFQEVYINISGKLEKVIELGSIYLTDPSTELAEAIIQGSYIIDKVDKMIVLPMQHQVKSSSGSFDLLNNLSLPNLTVDIINQNVQIGGLSPIYQINGRPQNREQVLAIKPSDISRIEYSSSASIRYMDQNAGGVINFILKERTSGINLFTNIMASPIAGFLNGVASTSFSYKKSEFSVTYSNNWRDYNKRRVDREDALISDIDVIKRVFKGKNSTFGYLSQDLNIGYTYQHDSKTMLSIIFSNGFGKQHDNSKSSIFQQSTINQVDFDRESRAHFKSYSPSLDIFFSKQLKNEQSIEFNLVGTLLNSTYNRTVTDDGQMLIDNEIDNHRESIIIDAVYQKKLKPFNFRLGIRHLESHTKNDYLADGIITEMNSRNTYPFIQLSGSISKLSYDIGTGLKIYWVDDKNNKKDYVKNITTINLLYPITKNVRVSYRFQLDPILPSLSQLSDVSQKYDTLSILKGNPQLKPFNTIRNRILFTLTKNKLRANIWFSYTRSNNPIATYSYYDSNILYFVSEYQNQNYNSQLNTQLDLSANSLFNFLSINASGGWNKFNSSGNGYEHSLYNLYWSMSLAARYKDFNLAFGYSRPQKSLAAEFIRLSENNSYITLMFKKQSYSFTLGLYYPLTKSWKAGEESLSSTNPYKQKVYIKDNGNMLALGFSYQFSSGELLKKGRKTLTNSDNDTGILKVQ